MAVLDELKKIGVDTETGLARFVGKQELYEKFLAKFVQDASYAGLKETIAKQDYLQAFEYAHSLKGVCGNLSLGPLAEQVGELTEILRNKESLTDEEAQKVADIMPEMDQNYQEIIRVIKENL